MWWFWEVIIGAFVITVAENSVDSSILPIQKTLFIKSDLLVLITLESYIFELPQTITSEKYKDSVILFETAKNGTVRGYTPNYVEVIVDGPSELCNKTAKVKITDSDNESVYGNLI